MTTLEHPVAPEEIMAMLDEELSSAERQAVLQHLAQCAECAAMRDQMQRDARALAAWRIPCAPPSLDEKVHEAMATDTWRAAKPRRRIRPLVWAGGGALAAVLALAVGISIVPNLALNEKVAQHSLVANRAEPSPSFLTSIDVPPERATQSVAKTKSGIPERPDRGKGDADDRMPSLSLLGATSYGSGGGAPAAAMVPDRPAGPMIARQVSLTILVKNIAASRTVLDSVLARHSGYAANLTISTPPDGARSFQASLRIPAPQLEPALANLRALGQVENESQSGEEVTQQHEDLVARLRNARETEDRLRGLLAQRTGKLSDVLEVEEQISETRGNIEQMEAEQQALEHRVDYASVELQLTEQYEEHLIGQPLSAGMQMRNSLVKGVRNAGSNLLALALFLEETGPTILVWAIIFGIPAWILVRRYRRARARL